MERMRVTRSVVVVPIVIVGALIAPTAGPVLSPDAYARLSGIRTGV